MSQKNGKLIFNTMEKRKEHLKLKVGKKNMKEERRIKQAKPEYKRFCKVCERMTECINYKCKYCGIEYKW